MNNKEQARKELLISVAKMYYIDRMTQQEIADRLFLSRSNISHLLKKCVDQNIVEFNVKETSSIGQDLQNRIKKRFSLKDLIIVPSKKDLDETRKKLGEAISDYLKIYLKNGMLIGVTWGKTIYNISKSFKPISNISVDVIQMVGGIEARDIHTDRRLITESLAKSLNGKAIMPLVPYVVKTEEVKKTLLLEPVVAEHFKLVTDVDIAILGLGVAKKEVNLSRYAGYFSDEDINFLEQEGAVSDICGIQFDVEGKQCASEISNRILGIGYKDLTKIPLIIGTTVGLEKTETIMASLLSGLISVLAIDEQAAFSLLSKIA